MMVVEHNFGVENRVNRLNRLFVLVKTEREMKRLVTLLNWNFSRLGSNLHQDCREGPARCPDANWVDWDRCRHRSLRSWFEEVEGPKEIIELKRGGWEASEGEKFRQLLKTKNTVWFGNSKSIVKNNPLHSLRKTFQLSLHWLHLQRLNSVHKNKETHKIC